MNDKTKGIVDFHTHTNKSDGTLSPTELVEAAKKANIKYLAVTDHDTTDGVEEAKITAEKLNIGFISGIEISSKNTGGILHILGYGIDIHNSGLQQKLKEFQLARKQRNDKILLKLTNMGIPVSKKEILNETKSTSSMGRPHIAQQLIKLGIVKNMDEAFQIYLGKKGKAFVDKEIFSPEETIDIIHQAGGSAVLAHPNSLNLSESDLEKFLKELIKKGLNGIEVYSSAHSKTEIAVYLKLSEKLHLFPTAGSDFHGSIKPNVQLSQCFDGQSIDIAELSRIPFNFN